MKIHFQSRVCLLLVAFIAGAPSLHSLRPLFGGETLEAEGPTQHSLRGIVLDSETGKAIQSRIYLQDHLGTWHLIESDGGNAVHYERDLPHLPNSPEVHTTLSANPFVAKLPPGQYSLRVERGKEYVPFEGNIEVNDKPLFETIHLQRWVNMAERGWYSGDTHVHRSIDELPNVMLAEDLNVALPLSYWVNDSRKSPLSEKVAPDADAGLIDVDSTHVIYTRNTEYEIFTLDGKEQTLGAVFALNHKTPLDLSVPPVAPLARLARREGALLDLDKHSWPWSLMVVPVMGVDLFELSNNHVWQTNFGFRRWTIDTISPSMQLQQDANGLTEWGWIDFGFKTYYALVNCGFRLRVSAGTASGVHPVPLGFGRVYVRLPEGFSYDRWIRGLNAGQSFVSTGPMLDLRFNGQDAGHHFQVRKGDEATVRVMGAAESRRPLRAIEIVVNGEVAECISPANRPNGNGGYVSEIDVTMRRNESFWTAVRCFEDDPDNRVRFAHTNPVYLDVEGSPAHPRKRDVDYFASRMEEEIHRLRGIATEEVINEYREALRVYQAIGKTAR